MEVSKELFDDDDIQKRLDKRKKSVELQIGMLGCSQIREMDRFKLSVPEIELCDIIKMLTEVKRKRNRRKYNSCVYIDICTDGKFYVGYSSYSYLPKNVEHTDDNMAKCRLEDHRNNGGTIMPTNFTYMYPVISCLISFPGDKEDEDLVTVLMSKCVGNNVRGGHWATPFIKPDYPNITVKEIYDKLLSRQFLTAL
jgi:hypothetical protein